MKTTRNLIQMWLLCAAMLPATLQAQFKFITNNNAITITDYTGPGGNVTIPSTTNGYPVTTIGTNAFYYKTTVTGAVIPNSVTSIGNSAFYYCSGLTSVTIPNSVTNIGDSAFALCSWLTNVTIGTGVTSIGSLAFTRCFGLTNVTIPNSVTNIGDLAFGACYGLTNIAVNAGNPRYASAGGVLFNKTLTTLVGYPEGLSGSYTISNSVTSIGNYAFYDCSGLISVTIPNSVTNIGDYAFEYCSDLTSVTIPNSVTSIGNYAFFYCSGLTSVTIPNNVTNIGDWAFALCSVLTNATIGSGVTSIGTNAFYYCYGLTSVTIPNSVTSIGNGAFEYCSSLHHAYFQGNAPSANGGPGSADSTVFYGESGTAYYMPGTLGWTNKFGGWPTALWYQPNPMILGTGYGLGVTINGFGFTISWATNIPVVVEACADLADANWCPLATNTLTSGTNYFNDSNWTNYPSRFYRIRSP